MTPRTFKNVLITGAGGSGGSYLADYIVANHPDVELHGIVRWHSATQDNLREIGHKVHLHEADLTDFASTARALQASKPDVIFHLAAHANVRASFDTPVAVLENNVIGTAVFFEALRLLKLAPVTLVASTSEVYGKVDPKNVPIGEDAPIQPANPYAVSKTAQDFLGLVYFLSYAIPVIRTRSFTYINPRRSDLFATSFARQVARVEAGLQSAVMHGNLESVRTLLDVRDVAEAYWAAAEYCVPGEVYNIGGNVTMKVGEVLERLIHMSGRPIPTQLDPALLRPTDVTLQIPNIEKFTRTTGWKSRYSIDDSLQWLLDYWREETRREVLARSNS